MGYSRAEVERLREGAKAVERREGRTLALVAVPGGLVQLLFLRWAEPQLGKAVSTPIAGGLFLLYLGAVLWLLVRMQRQIRAARVTCPACGVRMEEMSVRVAMATGRCDRCGGQVLDEPG